MPDDRPMTRGERQVWAATFGAFVAAGVSYLAAAQCARQAVDGLRWLSEGPFDDRQVTLDAMEMIRGRKMPT